MRNRWMTKWLAVRPGMLLGVLSLSALGIDDARAQAVTRDPVNQITHHFPPLPDMIQRKQAMDRRKRSAGLLNKMALWTVRTDPAETGPLPIEIEMPPIADSAIARKLLGNSMTDPVTISRDPVAGETIISERILKRIDENGREVTEPEVIQASASEPDLMPVLPANLHADVSVPELPTVEQATTGPTQSTAPRLTNGAQDSRKLSPRELAQKQADDRAKASLSATPPPHPLSRSGLQTNQTGSVRPPTLRRSVKNDVAVTQTGHVTVTVAEPPTHEELVLPDVRDDAPARLPESTETKSAPLPPPAIAEDLSLPTLPDAALPPNNQQHKMPKHQPAPPTEQKPEVVVASEQKHEVVISPEPAKQVESRVETKGDIVTRLVTPVEVAQKYEPKDHWPLPGEKPSVADVEPSVPATPPTEATLPTVTTTSTETTVVTVETLPAVETAPPEEKATLKEADETDPVKPSVVESLPAVPAASEPSEEVVESPVAPTEPEEIAVPTADSKPTETVSTPPAITLPPVEDPQPVVAEDSATDPTELPTIDEEKSAFDEEIQQSLDEARRELAQLTAEDRPTLGPVVPMSMEEARAELEMITSEPKSASPVEETAANIPTTVSLRLSEAREELEQIVQSRPENNLTASPDDLEQLKNLAEQYRERQRRSAPVGKTDPSVKPANASTYAPGGGLMFARELLGHDGAPPLPKREPKQPNGSMLPRIDSSVPQSSAPAPVPNPQSQEGPGTSAIESSSDPSKSVASGTKMTMLPPLPVDPAGQASSQPFSIQFARQSMHDIQHLQDEADRRTALRRLAAMEYWHRAAGAVDVVIDVAENARDRSTRRLAVQILGELPTDVPEVDRTLQSIAQSPRQELLSQFAASLLARRSPDQESF